MEELIKQEATIYRCYADVGVYVLHLKNARVDTAYLWVNGRIGIPLDSLFETKEDAEFALKYQNITRTETLSLPTWEEVQKDLEKSPDGDYVIADNERVTFIYYKPSGFEVISNCDNYNFGSTKDNYTEACEMCRKLFLGESK